MKWTLQLFLIGVLSITLFSSFATPVSAHASLVNSDPVQNASIEQTPPRVSLSFSEPVEPQSSTLRVLDATGSRVDNESDLIFSSDYRAMSIGIPSLSKGIYTVSWQVVSAVDGHPTRGSFSFGVQTIVPPPPSGTSVLEPTLLSLISEALIRWSLFLGQTLIVGTLLFQRLVLAPTLNENRAAASAEREFLKASSARRILSLSLVGTALAMSGTIGLIIVQWTGSGGVSFNQFLFGTRLGLTGLARLGLVGAIFLMIFYAIRARSANSVILRASMASGATILLLASLSGHNAAASFNPIMTVASDWLHLVGVAVWIGGLFSFAVVFPLLKGERFHQHLSKLIPRFSRTAIASVGVISLTGIYSAWLQVGSFSALLNTLYGNTLIAKVSLMILIVALGALTQLVWHPQIVKALSSLDQAGSALARLGARILTSVRTETVLAAVLLLSVGLLTALPPAVQFAQTTGGASLQSKVLTDEAEGVRFTLSIFPFRVGTNSFEVLLRDGQGSPTKNVISATFRFANPGASLGPAEAEGEPAGEGRFLLQGHYLSVPGNWSIRVAVTRTDAFDAIADFETNLEAYPGLDTARVVELPLSDSGLSILDTKVDGSGTVWFTLPEAMSIGRFQPGLNSLEIFRSNYTGSSPHTIAFDGEGNVWFTDASRHSIVSFDPGNKQFREFPLPTTGGQPTGIVFDDAGTAWFTEALSSQLRGFTPETGSFTPPILTTAGSRPGPIAIDQKQRVWFAEEATGKIGMLNITTLTINEYEPEIPASFITGIAVERRPDADVWFAEHGSRRISKFDPDSITFQQFPLMNPSAFPWGLTVDTQGNVWFAEHIGDKIGFYDVKSESFREFAIPTSESQTRNLSIDQLGNVWFGESTGKLGVLALEPAGIGLGSPAQDSFYTLISGVVGVAVAAGTVVFFIFHRKRTRTLVSPKHARAMGKMTIATSLHIVSGGEGSAAGVDLADIYLAGLLGLGCLYLALELRQKGAVKRLIIPISLIAIAASGLAFTFGVLPAYQPVEPPPGSVYVIMWLGSYQDPSVEPLGFVPKNITVVLGVNNTVAWKNEDSQTHTAHGDYGEFDVGHVQPGETRWHTFERAGVFTYHCHIHQGRNGAVIVSGG